MLVDNPKYDNLPDYDYNEISYNETYEDVNGDKKLEKRLVDLQRKKDGSMGIIPLILKRLLSEKKLQKKK